jgi:cobalamin transport system ATP-binding protein
MTSSMASNAPALAGRLRATGLAVGYQTRAGVRTVLADLNLTVHAGEFVCLLGPNGIGKSTLLRTLARMQPPLEGCIELDGTDMRELTQSQIARRLGVVLTERVGVEALSARRIVEFGRYPHSGWLGGLAEHDRGVVDRALDAVHIAGVASRDFNKLSDGERQRVMIARALAQEPALLLLDEPTAFLDVTSRRELMHLLRRLAAIERVAIIASTHEVELALRTADVIWLVTRDGRLIASRAAELILSGAISETFSGITTLPATKETTMKSISTMRGDTGETSLGGGVRVSKASARVETYGTVDELTASIGFARSICEDKQIVAFAKSIQQDLFKVGAALAAPPNSPKPPAVFEPSFVDRLTDEVHRLEGIEGMLSDWSIPGDHRAAAAFDVARTVCRRAERAIIRFQEAEAGVQPAIVAYLNRLSDLLWLFGRKLERDAGINSSLREATGNAGNPFSKAW